MPFCTTCGASVAGAFCNQCGTPVGTAAQGQPAPAAPYQHPIGPGAIPGPRKTSPIVWVLVIVLGLFVLGGIATVGVIGLVAHRARQAGLMFDKGPDGGYSIQARGADGKNARVEFGGSVGKLPSWVPEYPGSHPVSAMKGTMDGGAESGQFYFTTSDAGSQVKSFYEDRFKELGMKVGANVAMQSASGDNGVISATDEGGEQRSVMVVVAGQSGHTTVNVTYGKK